ncbi:hypothetical protein CPB86DRAFT_749524 [Serendipita vermifera]|nr:hypothetical protein CPB86DRAFT_749524 [Serendipita vermifera]
MAQLRSKFQTTYDKLFEANSTVNTAPNTLPSQYWTDLFSLQVDPEWLSAKFRNFTKEECLHTYKSAFGSLFMASLRTFIERPYDDEKKRNALETLAVILRTILLKDLAGWEVMELLAGSVSESDEVFNRLVEGIETVLEDPEAPVLLKHKTLQLALIFACGIGQLSPGAYLLRRDLFPVIVLFIKSSETTAFTFEAILLLSILSNYHKSEAANLNPYLKRLRGTVDHTFLSKVCWALGFAFDTAVKSYQDIQDDSPPSLVSAFGNLLIALRPDKALSSTPIETPREMFKDQPIEAAVVLLPLYELLQLNPVFPSVIAESLSQEAPSKRPPMVFSFMSLASYLFSHASSVGTPRSLAYANLAMRVCLLVSKDESLVTKLARETGIVRICRQRLPKLPDPPASRPVLCSLFDCCVLWLRHNLHKKLEVASYRQCILTVHSLLWTLGRHRIRLEYSWEELWRALIALLEFLSSRLDNVKVLGRVDELVEETLILLEYAVISAEKLMPTPEALHQFVYELIRSGPTIDKQMSILSALEVPLPSTSEEPPHSASLSPHAQALRAIRTIQNTSAYYQEKINQAGTGMEIGDVMKVIATEVERDGIHIESRKDSEAPPRRSESNSDVNFVKWACHDGLALLS